MRSGDGVDRRWWTRVTRYVLAHQQPAGGPVGREVPRDATDPRPAVGLVAGYRLRHGFGDRLSAWLGTELEARGFALAPVGAAGTPTSPACWQVDDTGRRVTIAVVPARVRAVDLAPVARLGHGHTVGLICYGDPAGDESAPVRDAFVERGAHVVDVGVLVDTFALREHGTLGSFERIALHCLLDDLLPQRPGCWSATPTPRLS